MNRAQQYIDKYERRIENCEHTSLYGSILMGFMYEILLFESKFPRELSTQMQDIKMKEGNLQKSKFMEEWEKTRVTEDTLINQICKLVELIDKHKADKEEG